MSVKTERAHSSKPQLVAIDGTSEIEEEGTNWPKPLDDVAFEGIAGEIVRAIEPH